MTKRSSEMKNLPPLPISKQMAATGLIVISGLLIFLLIGSLAPKTSTLLRAGREFNNLPESPAGLPSDFPVGVNLTNPTQISSGNLNTPLRLDLTKGFILSDEGNRISKKFEIPDVLRKQVSIYFDLYTKFSRDHWLVIKDGHNPAIVEEWSLEKLQNTITPPVTRSKINLFLEGRIHRLPQNYDSLRIQRGMKEDFSARFKRHKRWLATIEKMFTSNNLSKEYSRIFLIPANISLNEETDPWTALSGSISKKYLVQSKSIDEGRSPLKVARVLATVMKKPKTVGQKWTRFFDTSQNLDASFYAALYADIYRDKLEFFEREQLSNSKIQAFKLYRPTTIAQLIRELKIDLPIFLENNPDLVSGEDKTILPKTYVFFVGKGN